MNRISNRPVRLGVLISGSGTTLANFLARIEATTLNAEVAVVIASRADCGGVEKARAAGLPCHIIPRRDYADVA
ncbi:MAG: phosphoribosylglycinamide formyltransferase, partial [Planctomycetaceae bacterium]|nr:phosphoribosylglycinamide formyltransferase [Planctomycetaceae bacterium]